MHVKLTRTPLYFGLRHGLHTFLTIVQRCSGQFSSGGASGQKTQSASQARAAYSGRYPQLRPITSRMKQRWWEDPVVIMASVASIIRWSAESAPIVISVPQKSLSILPTIPTTFNCLLFCRCSAVIRSKMMLSIITGNNITKRADR